MFKKIFIILIATFIFAQYLGVSHGAGSDSSSDSGSDNYMDQYKTAKQFISRAEKLEKKDKILADGQASTAELFLREGWRKNFSHFIDKNPWLAMKILKLKP